MPMPVCSPSSSRSGNLRALAFLVALLAVLQAVPTRASAQPAAAPTPTRQDLALTYMRLDAAYVAAEPNLSAEQAADANRAFDATTSFFFKGQFAEAVKAINAQTADLLARAPGAAARTDAGGPTDSLRGALALSASVDPPVVVAGGSTPASANVRIGLMHPLEGLGAFKVKLAVRSRERIEGVCFFFKDASDLSVSDPAAFAPTTLALPALEPGGYEVVAIPETPAGAKDAPPPVVMGRFSVVEKSPSATREANVARLDAAAAAHPGMAGAVEIARGRNSLLSDAPGAARSAEFLAEPHSLMRDLDAEIAAIEKGEDPYSRRPGDFWRTLGSGRLAVPMRVFAPARLVGDEPVPLVIALHGAGGDENMFMDGYGAGLVKKLAEERGYLLVSPGTNLFAANSGNLDALIEDMAGRYAIDRERIYMVGHSMGGGATAGFAASHAGTLAACGLLCGGKNFNAAKIAPTLMIAAELDSIVPVARLKPVAESAKAAGLDFEYREHAGKGHTLVIPGALPEAIDWMLAKRLGR